MDPVYIGLLVPLAAMGVGAFSIYTVYRSRKNALDVLRTYAERGDEPSDKVLNALDPPYVSRRAGRLWGTPSQLWGQAASAAFVAIGSGALAVWAHAQNYRDSWVMIGAIVAILAGARAVGAAVQAQTGPRDATG